MPSSILAKKFTRDPECDGLMEKYRNADRQRSLRRRPGLDQLGSSEDSEVLISQRLDPPTPQTLSSPDLAPVKSLLAPLEIIKPDREKDH